MDIVNSRSETRMNKFATFFHASLLCHHLYVTKYTNDDIDYESGNDNIMEMVNFRFRYLTSWNLILQTVYLALAVYSDIVQLLEYEKANRIFKYVEKMRGFLFSSLIFPTGLFVSFTFWTIFNINRELIFPADLDTFVPTWVNHSIHTVILALPIGELTFRKKIPNLKPAVIAMAVFTTVYYMIYFLTYYESSKWLYKVFYVFTWHQKFGFVVYSYIFTMSALWLGIHIQKYIMAANYQVIHKTISKKLM